MKKNQLNTNLEDSIIDELNHQVVYFNNNESYQKDIHQTKFSSIKVADRTEIWSDWSKNILEKVNNDKNVLLNFISKNFFITDVPIKMSLIKKIIFNFFTLLPNKLKKLHPQINLLEDFSDFLKKKGLIDLLKSNPTPKTGNPTLYNKFKTYFTHRWIRHIWLLSLFNTHLKSKENINVIMDIGSNYGAFSYLLKSNYKKYNFILVDFPEALSTARYFLQKELPDAKIASFKDLKDLKIIDKDFLHQYDFVLVPCFWIDKIESNSVDLVSNFASFNEMNRYWFNKYISSKSFQTSKYIFLMNRFTRPAVEKNETPIDILDLELHKFNKIHFDVCELYQWNYTKRKYLFGIPVMTKKSVAPPVYEFIGER